MIIYFTGTGNSRFVAEAIADRLNDETVDALRYIKSGNGDDFSSDKPFIFVFPVYLSTAPAIFRRFIKASTFKGCKDAYFIPTCAGTAGSVPNAMSDLCKESDSLIFKGSKKVIMPQNYIAYFNMSDKAQQDACIENCIPVINSICDTITKGNVLDDSPTSGFEYAVTKLVEVLYNSSFTKTKSFRVTDNCSHCGNCSRLCPTNSIEMKDGNPVWIKKLCIHCMACINSCPAAAIEYGNHTVGKERYVCPKY